MNIIPVIDLINGVVVHARQGQRAHYLPIQSTLTKSINPLDIVKAFLQIYPFSTVYIADLDAIQQTTNQHNLATIEKIKQHFPEIKIWLDAGIHDLKNLNLWTSLEVHPVIGTESQISMKYFNILNQSVKNKFILSLDYMPNGYQGPKSLLNPAFWPDDVIVMSLNQVGSNLGVDTNTLQSILSKKKKHHRIYAAGGVRNIEDLHTLKTLSVDGVLIASALHQQQLTHQEIAKYFTSN